MTALGLSFFTKRRNSKTKSLFFLFLTLRPPLSVRMEEKLWHGGQPAKRSNSPFSKFNSRITDETLTFLMSLHHTFTFR